jgi:Arc/MetJ-type ribon-helix-helix transcriptional regulator
MTMPTLSIKLSKAQSEFVEAQMVEGGFKSVNAYSDALLKAELRRRGEEKLLRSVQEADASGPPTPLTPNEWEAIRQEVAAELAKRNPRVQKRLQRQNS